GPYDRAPRQHGRTRRRGMACRSGERNACPGLERVAAPRHCCRLVRDGPRLARDRSLHIVCAAGRSNRRMGRPAARRKLAARATRPGRRHDQRGHGLRKHGKTPRSGRLCEYLRGDAELWRILCFPCRARSACALQPDSAHRRSRALQGGEAACMRAIVTAFAVLAAYGGAGAQGYPEKQVVVVVPFPAGGATDPVARALTQRMSEIWKQPVIVLNRAGAGGNIGSESVARTAPDGHTLLFVTTSLAIGPSLYAKLSFDVLKDFATISQASIAPNILVVHPSLPARSVRELVALAKARPGQLISASAGTGTSNHLSLVQFVSLAKVDITHVPYKGAAPAVVDIVGGHAH